MNVALRRPMTLHEFLAWEERQELRYEFDGFQPIAMTGGTFAHSAIQRNLLFALTGRLRGGPCQPHGSHLKIEVAGRIRYPDAFVLCNPMPNDARVVTEPLVIFEILSPSTAHEDLFTKNAEYRSTRSVQRYVVLQQSHVGALVFSRHDDHWADDVLTGENAILAMPEIGIEIPLSEVYADLVLTPEDGEDER